ncbi:MAG: oligosaccharide flippase family protein [Bacteroidota bacterium]
MNPLKKLFGQTAIYGLGTVVPRLLNYLLLTPFYTRIFLKGEYGSVTELYAYVAFLLVLLTYGMETAFFRFAESEKNTKKVFSTSMFSLFFSTVLFVSFAAIFKQQIADAIQYSANKEYILYLAIIIGLDAFTSIPFAKLRHENKALKFALIKIANISVNIGLNFYFYLVLAKTQHIGIEYVFISNLIATGVTLILLLPDILKISFAFDFRLLKNMLWYALPLLIVGLAGMVNEVSDKIFLKYLTPADMNPMEQVGIYGANYKLAVLMTIFVQMFRYAAEPFFFSQAKEKDSKKTYADVMKFFIITGLIIFLGVVLYIDVVKYFIGPAFHEGLKIVPVVLLANLFLGIFYNQSIWYKLNNLTRYGAYIALFGAVLTIILNVVLIPIYGYTGSAWATFFCYFSMMTISYFWGNKVFYVPYNIKVIFFYFAISLIIFIISKYINYPSIFLQYFINTLMFLGFLTVVLYIERLFIFKTKKL